jgi:sugar phosphate isomerase/epimerase
LEIWISTTFFKHSKVQELPKLLSYRRGLALEFNLTPLYSEINTTQELKKVLTENSWSVGILDGGWCNFFENDFFEKTLISVAKQVGFARALGVRKLRLFIGHGSNNKIDFSYIDRINFLCQNYPDIEMLFETHDAFSCSHKNLQILCSRIEHSNFGLVIDPANILKHSYFDFFATQEIRDRIRHFHFKGLDKNGEYVPYSLNTADFSYYLALKDACSSEATVSVEIENGWHGTSADLYQSAQMLREDLIAD